MNAEERRSLLREVSLAGNCSHPIRLRGDMLNLDTGEVTTSALRVACKDRRRVVCPSCSALYKTDAWVLVSAGLIGGKGMPEQVGGHPRLFLTLTAPSFGSVHTRRRDGSCVMRAPSGGVTGHTLVCPHGVSLQCPVRHDEDDANLGRPLCVECFDYEGAVLWNAHASRLWNNSVQHIRRRLARAGGVTQTSFPTVAQAHYLKVAELQQRGLVHFHALLRLDGPKDDPTDLPAWATVELLAQTVRDAVRRAEVDGLHGKAIRWGRVLDVQDLGLDGRDAARVSSYLAKYVTKTTDGSLEFAHQFRSRRQIESLVDDPHARRLALVAWDLDDRGGFEPLHLAAHAHTFGFAGQLITKSRCYSTTFTALRAARAGYMADHRDHVDAVEGTFIYEGRGYDDPRASELAEMFFAMDRELRTEALKARRRSNGGVAEGSL